MGDISKDLSAKQWKALLWVANDCKGGRPDSFALAELLNRGLIIRTDERLKLTEAGRRAFLQGTPDQ